MKAEFLNLSFETLEIVYFVATCILYLILGKIFDNRNIMLQDEPILKIIHEDQQHFIMQIAMACMCCVMSFIFPASMSNIFVITFMEIGWLTRPSEQQKNLVKSYNLTDNPRYKRIVPVKEYMSIFSFMCGLFVAVMQMHNIWFVSFLLTVVIGISLWSIMQLEKIKQDYVL